MKSFTSVALVAVLILAVSITGCSYDNGGYYRSGTDYYSRPIQLYPVRERKVIVPVKVDNHHRHHDRGKDHGRHHGKKIRKDDNNHHHHSGSGRRGDDSSKRSHGVSNDDSSRRGDRRGRSSDDNLSKEYQGERRR